MSPLGPALALVLAAGPRVAVMPIAVGDAISDKSASFLTETLAAEIRQQSGAEVVTARDLSSLLSLEKQKQALGCSTDRCMVEIAGAVGAERLVTGDVAKLGESLLLQLRLLDASKGRVIAQSRRRYKNGTFDDVLDALPAMATELLRGPAAEATGARPSPPKPAMEAPRLAAAPGSLTLHYHRADGRYDSARLVTWESFETSRELRRPQHSIVPRNNGSINAPQTMHLPLVSPAGRDAFGAYWTIPAERYRNGRVNFVVAVGGDWEECGVDVGRFWLAQDGREAWYVECEVYTDPEQAARAATPR